MYCGISEPLVCKYCKVRLCSRLLWPPPSFVGWHRHSSELIWQYPAPITKTWFLSSTTRPICTTQQDRRVPLGTRFGYDGVKYYFFEIFSSTLFDIFFLLSIFIDFKFSSRGTCETAKFRKCGKELFPALFQPLPSIWLGKLSFTMTR